MGSGTAAAGSSTVTTDDTDEAKPGLAWPLRRWSVTATQRAVSRADAPRAALSLGVVAALHQLSCILYTAGDHLHLAAQCSTLCVAWFNISDACLANVGTSCPGGVTSQFNPNMPCKLPGGDAEQLTASGSHRQLLRLTFVAFFSGVLRCLKFLQLTCSMLAVE